MKNHGTYAFIAMLLCTAGSASAQTAVPCPNSVPQTITAAPPSVDAADFNAASLAAQQPGLHYSGSNKQFLYTFKWRSPECCKIMSATLTVKMHSNEPGSGRTASDSGNDRIAIVAHGGHGAGIPGYGDWVYTSPTFPQNQAASRVWNLTGAALASLNANNTLSFVVEDDTSVDSATLVLNRCCINKPG